MLHFSNGEGAKLVWTPLFLTNQVYFKTSFRFKLDFIDLKNPLTITRIYGNERLHVIIQ